MTPQARQALVLDLDGTLLHTEPTSGVEIPGRTRSAYLAAETIAQLKQLAETMDLVIATARSWGGTQPVLAGLAAHGVAVAGVITEDGAMLGTPGAMRPLGDPHDWPALKRSLAAQAPVPFAWQTDFEACLVGRCADREAAAALITHWQAVAGRLAPTLRSFQDGRKVYATDRGATKWEALVALLGARAEQAAGVGDGLNDVCWLSRVALPCAFGAAQPEVARLVERSGLWAPEHGHHGIKRVLERLAAESARPSASNRL